MLAAALFASLLAQAEQAPPQVPAEPRQPQAAPAVPAPATAPATPPPTSAPPAPAPAAPSAAAPVPPAAPPPLVAQPEPPAPANSVSVHVRYAYRVGGEGDGLVPASGLSLGGEFERRLAAFQSGIELGVATNFFYDRFTKDIVVASAGAEPGIGTRTLSQTSFALMETNAWRYADMRLFVAVGGGVTVGYFASPDLSANSTTDVMAFARGVAGFDFAIAARTAAILRFDYSHTFKRDSYYTTTPGDIRPLFGDLFDAGIGLLVRF